MQNITNRVAVVTGSSSGIGFAVAQHLAKAGARVVLVSNESKALQAAEQKIKAAGGVCICIETDITDEPQVIHLFQQTIKSFGRVDLLVNNAGIATSAPLDATSLQDWQQVLDVNLTGAFLCSREAFIMMKKQGAGRIINIGSVSSKVPRANSVSYVASKAGLEGLTKSLALEGRDCGITATILYLGNTMSGFWERNPDIAATEAVMSKETVANMVLHVANLPDEVLMTDATILPMNMPYLGRG
jgi:NAD(P)-dependent dehydrogenase (short-subunit alcohol dehydrogenase family)